MPTRLGSLCRSLLAVASLCGCGTPAAEAPSWGVSGGFIRSPDGRAVVLHGANVTGTQKSAPYIDAQTTLDDYLALGRTWGMNSVRFLMPWAAVEPERGRYDEAWLDAVVVRMAWARQAGLRVVLDSHQDIYGEGFGGDGAPRWTCDDAYYKAFKPSPEFWALSYLDANVQACVDHFYTDPDVRAHFAAAWRHVAQRLAGEDVILGFDILNEPHWGTYPSGAFEAERLQPMYEEVIAAVRAEAPHWLVFAEPGSSRNLGISTGLAPFADKNIVYSPHEYDSMAEASGMFDVTHRQKILDNMKRLRVEAGTLGAALWIGEYGGIADSAAIGDYMKAVMDGAGSVAASTSYWDYSRGGGYSMRAADGTPKTSLLDAIVRPYPESTAGAPRDWAFDASTRTFTLHYDADPAIAGPTEIVVPARVYPSGYTVECGGCTYEKGDARLRITAPPSIEPATVVLHP